MEASFSNIIKLAKDGDVKAQEQILEKYKPLIYKNAMSYYIKNYEYDDLFQICRVSVLDAIQNYNNADTSYFTAYVQRAVRNNLNNIFRKCSKHRYESSLDYYMDNGDSSMEFELEEISVEMIVEKNLEVEKLIKVLSNLPSDDREFLMFLYSDKKNTLMKWSDRTGIDYQKLRRRRNKILNYCKSKLD